MNKSRLLAAEAHFLSQYPLGMHDPALASIVKRHDFAQVSDLVVQAFSDSSVTDTQMALDVLQTAVGRSSLISMFDKPKFKALIGALDQHQAAFLIDSMRALIHGPQADGFNGVVNVLSQFKLARWPLVTLVPMLHSPITEVFVKPNTAKAIIVALELHDLHYKPTPTWEFYRAFRDTIHQLRALVSPSLSPSNAAFTGFLMMEFASS